MASREAVVSIRVESKREARPTRAELLAENRALRLEIQELREMVNGLYGPVTACRG